MPIENTTMKKATTTASSKTDREDKNYHYKVRITGLAESHSKFVIDCQLRDEKKVIESLNCSGNVIETQCLGNYDKDKNRTRNLFVTFGSVWDAQNLIAKAFETKFFQNENVLITAELSAYNLALEKKVIR